MRSEIWLDGFKDAANEEKCYEVFRKITLTSEEIPMPYSIRNDGSAIFIDVRPAEWPRGSIWFMYIIVAVTMTSCTSFSMMGGGTGGVVSFLLGLTFCALSLWGVSFANNKSNAKLAAERAPVSIRIENGVIYLPASEIEVKKIHRVAMRNVRSGQIVQLGGDTMIVAGTGVVGAAGMATVAALHGLKNINDRHIAAQHKKLVDVSWEVNVEAGGVAYLLAQGLTEPAAYGLMKDVSSILEKIAT